MLAKEIMKKDLVTVKRSTTLRELITRLQDFHTIPLVPVIEKDSRLVGTVSFNSLIDVFLPYEASVFKVIPFLEREDISIFELEITPEMGFLIVVDDIMDTRIIAVDEEEPLEKVYNLMKKHSLDKLPVVNRDKQLVGMIGDFDILVAVFRQKGIIEG